MELLPLLLLFGLLGLMMYFMSRRQRRAVQQQQALQTSLTVGDRVMTTSGLYGTILDTSDETTVELEIAPGVETTWLRAAVREKVGPEVDVEEFEDEELTDDVEETDDAEVQTPVAESNAQVAAPLEHDKQKS
ncbi:MAG: preprotein translocase subunit YajC [Labedaea sp.]